MANTIAPIGATIPAAEIRPGYILDLGDPGDGSHNPLLRQYPVERVNASCAAHLRQPVAGVGISYMPSGDLPRQWEFLAPTWPVRIVGYFNPENR